jgi:hypothetical protein
MLRRRQAAAQNRDIVDEQGKAVRSNLQTCSANPAK